MIARTVDWTPPHQAGEDSAKPEGLRERKKRRMRQQLTDTATEMFLERGFDAVRVAEIADACGVSEKTVFNYFPTKEALIVDHPGAAMDALRTALADPGPAPVDAVLRILAGELDAMTSWLGAQPDLAGSSAKLRRFGALIAGTPSLRAYQRDMMDRLAAVATEALAERAGLGPDDPEPRIAATALLGLWPIQFSGWARYADGVRTPAQIRDAVTADVRKAARLLDGGLGLLTAQR